MDASSTALKRRASGTTPITSVQVFASPSTKHFPIALSPGQRSRAMVSLTIATELARSATVNPRPRTGGRCSGLDAWQCLETRQDLKVDGIDLGGCIAGSPQVHRHEQAAPRIKTE